MPSTVKTFKHRLGEWSIWLAITAVFWVLAMLTSIADMDKSGQAYDLNAFLILEFTSYVSVFFLITFVQYWYIRFPFHKEKLFHFIVMHALGTVIFSLAHVLSTFVLRGIVISTDYITFLTSDPLAVFIYEYLKDISVYITIVALVSMYELYKARHIEGPESLPEPGLGPSIKSGENSRLLVKKGSGARAGEQMIEKSEILWMKGASNYIEIHTESGEFLVRNTMKALLEKLNDSRFVRTHKSFIVNLDKISEIKPTDSGDFRLVMSNKMDIPLSRRYRSSIKDFISI